MFSIFKENKILLLLSILLLFGIGISIMSLCDTNNDDNNNDNVSNKTIEYNNNKHNKHNKTVLTLYFAKWCGHCNTFKPTWEQIKNDKNNLNYVDFNTVDCSGDSQETSIQQTPNGTDLDGFPTIILSKNGKDKIYNGTRNKKVIEDYIKNNN